MLGGEHTDSRRTRVGLAVLMAGLVALGWAWGNWAFRASRESQAEVVRPVDRPPMENHREQAVVRSLPLVLLSVFAVLLVFLAASYVIARAARRARAEAGRRADTPTAAADVWATHAVRDDFDEDDAGSSSASDPPRPD